GAGASVRAHREPEAQRCEMLVAIEVEVGVAPVIDRPEVRCEERGDRLPVARRPRGLETVPEPRRGVLDVRRWLRGRQRLVAGARGVELVEVVEVDSLAAP